MALPAFLAGTATAVGATGSLGSSPALATTTGQFLFVGSTHYTSGVNVSAVTDTAGNTFVRAGTVQGGDANQDNEVWYTPDPIAGNAANIVTVRYSGNAAFRDISQVAFSWGGATSITYYAEAAHTLDACPNLISTSISVEAEALIIGNFVAYDAARALSNSAIGTIAASVGGGGVNDMCTLYRLVTASGGAVIGCGITSIDTDRYSIVAKSFRALAGGGTATAADMHQLTLTNAGR